MALLPLVEVDEPSHGLYSQSRYVEHVPYSRTIKECGATEGNQMNYLDISRKALGQRLGKDNIYSVYSVEYFVYSR